MYHKGSCSYNLVATQWAIINYKRRQLNEKREIEKERV